MCFDVFFLSKYFVSVKIKRFTSGNSASVQTYPPQKMIKQNASTRKKFTRSFQKHLIITDVSNLRSLCFF